MQGKIIKGIGGFYYVNTGEGEIYECRARGIFRKEGKKPLVGDDVKIEVLDEQEKTGNLVEILPRKNRLIRPAVANVDQALVLFAAADPKPNLNLLDRFLILMEQQQVPVTICFNKADLLEGGELDLLKQGYEAGDYPVHILSVRQQQGMEEIRSLLTGKTTVMAGPSGVGKSSLLNEVKPDARMETGEVSQKIKRGRHTTRHSEFFQIGPDSYLMDTPGFSSIYLEDIDPGELQDYFPEFRPLAGQCRFTGCAHVGERDCGVKTALEEGKISRTRYENYVLLYQELKEKRRYPK
ncbi:ribosome small subunit-dependent GTPase A [Cuneatibacter caecimuris]|uniref:Small ribosomal subunit biogenesis GTPase RsgA n=1 Tax=Cuneatibacter caecimuris TaxID=1796618 RepID=A0A4Q7PQ16_9FIRM|nr:ribosome small subunit-dependent GTPase A [Cuneatibacter caecimuris]RZT02148.1 ribosome biogenesis GTPase [Cuneatibacter caecimuris]